jgi:hypothetical protein
MLKGTETPDPFGSIQPQSPEAVMIENCRWRAGVYSFDNICTRLVNCYYEPNAGLIAARSIRMFHESDKKLTPN